jgi:hypothetical protein
MGILLGCQVYTPLNALSSTPLSLLSFFQSCLILFRYSARLVLKEEY